MPTPYELNIRDYVRIIRRRRWIILFCFLVTVGSSVFYTMEQKPSYKVSTTVRIQERSPEKMFAGIPMYPMWDMDTETIAIGGFKVVQEVAGRLGRINTQMSEEERNDIIKAIQSQIYAERVEQTNLIKVNVTSMNPEEPVKIANLLTAVYIEENYKMKSKEKRSLRIFLERQLSKYEKDLVESEKDLLLFKENLPINLQSQTLDSIARIEDDSIIIHLKNYLVKLELRLIGFLGFLTEKHPVVVSIREQISKVEKQLNERIEEFMKQVKIMPETNIQFARFIRNLNLNRDLCIMFRKKLEEARIAEAEEVADVEIVEPAAKSYPIMPNRTMNVAFGALMGIVLGFLGAFISENLDVSIGTIEEVEEFLQVPVLGVVPYLKGEEGKKQFWSSSAEPSAEAAKKIRELRSRLITQYSPGSITAEAFRVIQTNIQFTALEKLGNTIIFTSVGAREGKTITAANSAITIAQMGKKVLLVDCDFRRPAIHKIFGLPKEGGISEVLIGDLDKEEAIKTFTDILLGDLAAKDILQSRGLENLSVVFTGHLVPNPATLVNSAKMLDLIHEWKNKYDVVIFDSSPVLPVSDVSILASKVDAVVFVYQVGKVARSALRRAKTQLENVGGKVVGVVLNNVRATEMDLGDSYYYYRYGYGKERENQETA